MEKENSKSDTQKKARHEGQLFHTLSHTMAENLQIMFKKSKLRAIRKTLTIAKPYQKKSWPNSGGGIMAHFQSYPFIYLLMYVFIYCISWFYYVKHNTYTISKVNIYLAKSIEHIWM